MQLKTLALTIFLSTTMAAPSVLPRQSAAWSIRKFTRNCTDPNICTYNLSIDLNDGSTPVNCTVVDIASPATTHAFYNIACQQVLCPSLFNLYYKSG